MSEPKHPNAGAKRSLKLLGHLEDGPVSFAEGIVVPAGFSRYGHPIAVILRTGGRVRRIASSGAAASRYAMTSYIPAYMADPVSPSSSIRLLNPNGDGASTPQFAVGPRSGQDFACFLLNRSGHVREQEAGRGRVYSYDRYMPGADPRRNPGRYCRYCATVVRPDGRDRPQTYPDGGDKCPISPTFHHEVTRMTSRELSRRARLRAGVMATGERR